MSQELTSKGQIRFYGANSSTAGSLQFTGTSSDGSVGQERMLITAAGAIEIKGAATTLNGNAFITNTDAVMTIGSTQSAGVPKDMAFFNGAERMRIQATTGNVGINETSPTATLQVNGDIKIGSGAGSGTDSGTLTIEVNAFTFGATGEQGMLVRNNGQLHEYATIGFGYSESKCPVVIGSIITDGGGATNGAFVIGTRSTTTGSDAPTERMRVSSGGNVIVGGTAVDAAGSGSIKSTGIIRSVLASGTADSTLINAISGVSNGFQLLNDAGNNQEYIFHNGGTQSLKIDSSGDATFAGNLDCAKTIRSTENGNPSSGVGTELRYFDATGEKYGSVLAYDRTNSAYKDIRVEGLSVELRVSGSARLTINSSGNATFTGSVSKASGSFRIDHPLEAKKDTHQLVHSFVEGPQADLIYRGKIDLVGGAATINIDTAAGMTEGTFVALNANIQCFTTNESNWDLVKGSVSGNILTIESKNTSSTATISWLVIGERHDQHMKDTDWTDSDGKVIVEPLKPEDTDEPAFNI